MSFKFFFNKLYILLISMSGGRRRKIEVPRDTQPQFELGDTAEDIERRRREREEREKREIEESEGKTGNRDDRCDRRNRGDIG